MLTVTAVSPSLFEFNLINVACIGGAAAPSSPKTVPELTIPWRTIQQNCSELSLLSWHNRLSTFTGRLDEMHALHTWANAKREVSIKFVTGEGGMGKSRLAAEFGEALKIEGWAAGFVDLRTPQTFRIREQGTLIIIDYPEENQSGVEEFLKDLSHLGPEIRKLRVLFLTRRPIDGWLSTVEACHCNDLADMQPIEIYGLSSDAAYELFSSAFLKITNELRIDGTVGITKDALDAWLSDSEYNHRALFILALAMYHAQCPEEDIVELGRAEVLDVLVDRELIRLTGISKDKGLRPKTLERLVAMATICDNLPMANIYDLRSSPWLKFPTALAKERIRELINDAGLLLEDQVPALRPDILGAAFVHKVLSRMSEEAGELLWSALAVDLARGLGAFARLSYDAEVVFAMHEHRMSKLLAGAVDGKVERCERFEGFFETIGVHGLLETAIAACNTLLKHASDDDKKALYFNNLSNYISNTGDNHGALEAIKLAVEIYGKLAKANPARFVPDLAGSLNNLSIRLSDAGDNHGALEAIKLAVEIYEASPAAFDPDLAMSLNNLSLRLSDAGDNHGALEASKRAIEIYGRLAKANPARFVPDLAMSLNNLSSYLSKAGDDDGALEASKLAIEIYGRLAKASPARFEPDLATSLNNLSNDLSNAGDNHSALEVSKQALDIRRRLAKANPARFEPDLAMSLNNHSKFLSNAGDNPGALEAIKQAVEIRQRLAKASPARFEPDLATSLGAKGYALMNAGRAKEAAACFKQGMDIIRPHAQAHPQGPAAKLLQRLEADYNKVTGLDQ